MFQFINIKMPLHFDQIRPWHRCLKHAFFGLYIHVKFLKTVFIALDRKTISFFRFSLKLRSFLSLFFFRFSIMCRAVSLHLARLGSQSQRGIWLILPARGACHVINMYILNDFGNIHLLYLTQLFTI